MSPEYQIVNPVRGNTFYRRLVDGAEIPTIESAPGNADSLVLAKYLADGGQVLAADPPPTIYAGTTPLEARVQTSGTTPAELIRLPLTTLTIYGATVEVLGIDADNGVVKSLVFRSVFKRLNGGAQAVGPRVDIASHLDTGAAATTAGVANWTITPSLNTNDAVITVTGHTGRTVNWFAFVTIKRFGPGGLS